MSNDFTWDKILGEPEGSQDASGELAEILDSISEEPEEADTAPAVGTAPTLEAVEGGGTFDPYVPAPLPKNLVEPEKVRPAYDTDYKPDYQIEAEMKDASLGGAFKAAPKDVIDDRDTRDQSKFFVADNLQAPRSSASVNDAKPIKHAHIDEILKDGVERKASDIHLTAGLPPMARVDGEIVPLNYEILGPEHTQRLMYDILTDENIQKFESTHELDFAYTVKGLARFRCNIYVQRHATAAALRMIPNRIPTYEDLRLPPVIREIAKRNSGLVLVTGPTGSGKSTTIAAMIDDINNARQGHILTIEDPIEYLHTHKKCMVNQREMHSDTYSFHNALRAVLREDPDIILVGELRDLETIEAALTLAETGHLVFGTLHTRNAPSTIDRVVDVFSADQQDQIRVLLSNTLEGVISQQLLPKLGGGRVAALEIMVGIPAIKNLIREAKTHQMYSVIETNRQIGMQTLDSHLADLFKTGYVSYEECAMRAVDKETFAHLAKAA